ITLKPPALATVTPSSVTVTGGTGVLLQFTLTAPAAGGTAVTVGTGNSGVAFASFSSPVPAGRSSGTVNIWTNPVTTATPVTLSLSTGGVTKTVIVTVNPPPI